MQLPTATLAAAVLALGFASGGSWAAYETFYNPPPQQPREERVERQGGGEREDDEDLQDVPSYRDEGGEGGNNIVVATNTRDGRFELQGSTDYSKVRGDRVSSHNEARAESTCVDCQTIAVALQIVVYRKGASYVAPANVAIAINENCTRCVTIARAIQYVIPVDDFDNLPDDVKRLTKRIDRQLKELERIRTLEGDHVAEVENGLNQVLADFQVLAAYVIDYRDEERRDHDDGDERRATETPVAATPSAQGTPVTASPTATPMRTPGASIATQTPTPTATAVPATATP